MAVQVDETQPTELPPFRDGEGHIAPNFLDAVERALTASDTAALRDLAGDLHEADLADLLEALGREDRLLLIQQLGSDFDITALTEVDESVRDEILQALPHHVVAEAVRDLDSDDAVSLLQGLDEEDRSEILSFIPAAHRAALRRSLDYPEESAGRRMQTDFIAVPPFWTVGNAIDYARDTADLPEEFYEVYVVDPAFRFIGTVSLSRLMRAKRPVRIDAIISEARHVFLVDQDQEEVARAFARYNLVAAPVVNDAGRLVGVITVDDILDVIQEEAEEDIRRLAGVGDEEISDSVRATVRSRFPWLFVNMFTAFLAASVIGLFDGTIEQMVALAVLMPIVASMGGNAGTQAMTVAVRALAMRELSGRNVRRVLRRELLVAFTNGAALALLIGSFAAFWFSSVQLGGVIAAALVINLIVAGLFGSMVPLLLQKLKIDPAVASTVFVTTITDVVGFFAFLGLAAWWFGLS
jgi:magnesium transporter